MCVRRASPAASPATTFTASDAAFAFLLALVSTALAYRFGVGNQIEQLPMILRQIDAGYLTNDVFVSSSATFGPRFYFARIVALTCQWMSLPWAYAVLRFVSDLALIAVTMWTAVRVIGADRLGAMVAAVLTVAVSAIHLGDATELRYAVFQPASLSIPGMLLAIALGLRGQPIGAAVAASMACVPHPLYGAYGGGVGLAAAFVALFATHRRRGAAPAFRLAALRTGVGAALFGAALIAIWWWPAQEARLDPLSTEELFDILARFRSPHHYLPSHFRPEDYVTLAFFLGALALAYERWHRAAPRHCAAVILVPILIALAGCVAGVLFTEIWPLRSVLTLQPFRLLAVMKWIGFLLLASTLADYWQRPPATIARPVVGMSLLSSGGAHPLVSAAGLALVRFRSMLPAAIPALLLAGALGVFAVTLSFVFGSLNERVRLAASVVLLAAFAARSGGIRAMAGCVTVVMALAIAANRADGPALSAGPFESVFSFEDLRDVEAEAARAAARHSPADAIFVAPPAFGILRLVGQRAVVVDFEATPLQDAHMRAWRERIRDVYGEVESAGHDARAALDRQYRQITDAHLAALANRYGATHAVLYAETTTALPAVHEDRMYRIVRLPAPEKKALLPFRPVRLAAVE